MPASLLTHFGGLWAFLAAEMSFEFVGPVYMGDTVTAESEMVEVSERDWVRLAGRVIGPGGNEVLRATIRSYPGQFDTWKPSFSEEARFLLSRHLLGRKPIH
ncbi:MAG: hypothetical protein KA586_05175 [Candidatus Promineofilum sp.]|nr:hypothetical protein [Promineifilum sp.]